MANKHARNHQQYKNPSQLTNVVTKSAWGQLDILTTLSRQPDTKMHKINVLHGDKMEDNVEFPSAR